MTIKLSYRHLLLLTLLSLPGSAHGQGTAINYQGRLDNAGIPATGLYDFTFHVFDAAEDGTDLAGPLGPLPYDAVLVTNGLFNVTLDFGPDIFSGPARWLEITVRTNGFGEHVILSPRTPMLPTPYAIFAAKAGAVATGTLTADQLNSSGPPPVPGQFLSYDGASFRWRDPVVDGVWSLNGTDAYYIGGKIGIGTEVPANKFTVLTPTLQYGIEHTDGDIRLGTFVGRATGYLGTLSNHKLTFFANDNGLENMTMTLSPGGNVGIGTATPVRKLTLRTPGYGFEHTDGTVRLGTYLNPSGGWLGTVSDHPLKFFVNDGVLPSVTIDGNGTSLASGSGFVSVGTPNGESGLTITRGGNRADVRFEGSTLKLVAGPVGGPPASTRGIAITTAGNVGIGTTSPSRTLEVSGDVLARDVSCRVLEIRGGADLAEPFAMSHSGVEPGSVVVIDEDQPGKLCRSTRAYDNKVAGIVSGANGIRPGINMIQEDKLEAGENVALSGRVYVQADAAFGAIKPGDLLTTSATPGHAMKVTEHRLAQGAILGKAMSALKTGKGLVLVLVTLQ